MQEEASPARRGAAGTWRANCVDVRGECTVEAGLFEEMASRSLPYKACCQRGIWSVEGGSRPCNLAGAFVLLQMPESRS